VRQLATLPARGAARVAGDFEDFEPEGSGGPARAGPPCTRGRAVV